VTTISGGAAEIAAPAGVILLIVAAPPEVLVWVEVLGCEVPVCAGAPGPAGPGDWIERAMIDSRSTQVAPTSLVVATRLSITKLTSVLSCLELTMPSRMRAAAA